MDYRCLGTGFEEIVWTQETRSNRIMKKIVLCEVLIFALHVMLLG
jgi:hypothetical protein